MSLFFTFSKYLECTMQILKCHLRVQITLINSINHINVKCIEARKRTN